MNHVQLDDVAGEGGGGGGIFLFLSELVVNLLRPHAALHPSV